MSDNSVTDTWTRTCFRPAGAYCRDIGELTSKLCVSRDKLVPKISQGSHKLSGEPSQDAKEVVSRLRIRPDVTYAVRHFCFPADRMHLEPLTVPLPPLFLPHVINTRIKHLLFPTCNYTGKKIYHHKADCSPVTTNAKRIFGPVSMKFDSKHRAWCFRMIVKVFNKLLRPT